MQAFNIEPAMQAILTRIALSLGAHSGSARDTSRHIDLSVCLTEFILVCLGSAQAGCNDR